MAFLYQIRLNIYYIVLAVGERGSGEVGEIEGLKSTPKIMNIIYYITGFYIIEKFQ